MSEGVAASDGIRAMWMRGGASKGGYFLKDDLPAETAARDALLLRIMGSPDPRQIDGLGGAAPLTSKVAVVSRAETPGVDVDYLFLQVFVDRPLVSDAQTCGNILAGVAPFAIERGLVQVRDPETEVTIRNTNTGQIVRAVVATPGGAVCYAGEAAIDGVPGWAAAIPMFFSGITGSSCGVLLPTGRPADSVQGLTVTLIDNGMPAVLVKAADLGLAGDEDPEALESDTTLRGRIEALRLEAGPLMALGDVAEKSVPKMCIVSPPRQGGAVMTRCFIPHDCHRSIGVLCAVSVATGCLLDEGPAAEVATAQAPAARSGSETAMAIEHPAGQTTVMLRHCADGSVVEAGTLRTARKLFDGRVFA